MATNVIMPALGIAQETGKLLQWLKNEGQAVTKGEVLMVVETDKATVEIEAPDSGTLSQVTAQPGDEVPVGHTIAYILAPGETRLGSEAGGEGSDQSGNVGANKPVSSASKAHVDRNQSVPIVASPLARRIAEENNVDLALVKPAGEKIEKADVLTYIEAQQRNRHPDSPTARGGLMRTTTSHVQAGRGSQTALESGHALESEAQRLTPASPKARKLAAESRLDLVTLSGSGPQGAILYEDVVKAVQSSSVKPAAEPAVPGLIKPGTIWRIMAERTTQSWTSVPHFYLTREFNAKRLMTWRDRAQKHIEVKITYTDLLVRLVAAALQQHPRVNVSWHDGAIQQLAEVNIGLAVAVEEGLVVPVIHHADGMNIAELAKQRSELIARAQANRLRPEDISAGTFTISNLGMYGIDVFHAIVNAPQAAILAVGRIVDRVVPVDGLPAVQPMMTLTLSCDHRAIDGARGAKFLQTLAEMIEEPLGLLD